MPSSKEGRIPSLAKAEWLNRPATAKVFAALEAEGAEARIVGGAVRNALMGLPVKDVDMATTALPAATEGTVPHRHRSALLSE